jgi:hypothetical protein
MNGLRKTFAIAAAVSMVCLSSAGAMAANKLIVKDSGGTLDKFVVTDAGQIGSGITTPASAFHAQGNAYNTTQVIAHWNGTLALYGGGGFVGMYNRTGNLLPLANDRLGYFLFGTMNAGSKLIGGGLNFNAQSDWTTTSVPTYIAFLTAASGSTTLNERARITSSGNMGIGAFAPTQKLEVNGGVRLNTVTSKPLCDSANGPTNRGTLWVTRGGTGVADKIELCIKNAAENYAWTLLF